MIRVTLLLILAIFFSFSGEALPRQNQGIKPSAAVKPKTAGANFGKYDFSFKTLDGKDLSIGGLGGKILLVNIWAPWCEPCKKESEGLARLYKAYKKRGFEIVGIAVKTSETAVRSFMLENKVSWPVGIKNDITKIYKSIGLPQSYLFNRDGSLAREFVGYAAEEALRQEIELILKPGK